MKRNELRAVKKRPAALNEPPTSLHSTNSARTPSPTAFSVVQKPTSATSVMTETTSRATIDRIASETEKGNTRSDGIQHVTVGSVATPIKRIACSICNRELKPGMHVILPCKHAAHVKCATNWFNRKKVFLKPGCPACSEERYEKELYSTVKELLLAWW